jgi:carbon monoxide dehydrogenase subunit G
LPRVFDGALPDRGARGPGTGMDIRGEFRLNATREAVWAALNDPDVLRECIPGCQRLERISENVVEATIAVQLGPVKAPFGTRIELLDLDPPRSYTLVGEGKSAAGFGRGEARVTLEDEGHATVLHYAADLKLGGKLAQVGARLLEGATAKLADEFFTKFAARFGPLQAPAAQPARTGAGRLVWLLLALAALAAAAVWLLRSQ